MTKPDFIVQNHGSIIILLAVTAAAQQWVTENLPDDAQTWGRNGTVIEPRYIGPIVNGIEAEGLVVS